MSDIFLSYASSDREHIRPLVNALEEHGWSVFWDRQIPVGKTWRGIIGKEITDSLSIVVVWTKDSVQSEWVMEEAEEGKRCNNLFPVSIDGTPPPFGFGSIQSADISNWECNKEHPGYMLLIRELSNHIDTIKEQEKKEGSSLKEEQQIEPELPIAREQAFQVEIQPQLKDDKTDYVNRESTLETNLFRKILLWGTSNSKIISYVFIVTTLLSLTGYYVVNYRNVELTQSSKEETYISPNIEKAILTETVADVSEVVPVKVPTTDIYKPIENLSSNRELNIDNNITQNESIKRADNIEKFSLTIKTEPVTADKVRILNIKSTYYDGIQLTEGKYHIEVSKDGYQTVKKWVLLNDSETSHIIQFKKFASGRNAYVVQLLATSNAVKANTLKDTLNREGYSAHISKTTRGGKSLYRVRTGPFKGKSSALKNQATMKQRHSKNAYVQSSIVVKN